MARGPARAAEAQLGTENQVAGQFGGAASGIANQNLIPFYENQLSAGPTPSESAAHTNANEQINENYAGAGNKMEAEAARTRNDAGVTAGEDLLAQQKGQALSTESNDILAQQEARQQNAGKGLDSMYGTNVEAEKGLYGLAPETINTWNTASQNPLLQAGIGAAGQFGGALIGKGGLLNPGKGT
jgi:hypothetical protein